MPPSSATRTSRKEHSGVSLGLGQVASPGTGCLEQEPGGGDAFMECYEATPLPQSWNWAPALQHSKSFFSGGAPGSAQAPSAVMVTAGGWQWQCAQLSFSEERAAYAVFQETPDIKAQSLTVTR